jgi:hypothetical protein
MICSSVNRLGFMSIPFQAMDSTYFWRSYRGSGQYDNALAETINGLYKAEVIHRRGPWRSMEAVEYATLDWVDWFNNRGLLPKVRKILDIIWRVGHDTRKSR